VFEEVSLLCVPMCILTLLCPPPPLRRPRTRHRSRSSARLSRRSPTSSLAARGGEFETRVGEGFCKGGYPARVCVRCVFVGVARSHHTKHPRYILARDYLTLKLWDMHMESKPVRMCVLCAGQRLLCADLTSHSCARSAYTTTCAPSSAISMRTTAYSISECASACW
jgi:hypothetical protein